MGSREARGHALLAYAADADLERIYVADPNYPEDGTRYIQYNPSTQTFTPFMASPNAVEMGAKSICQPRDVCDCVGVTACTETNVPSGRKARVGKASAAAVCLGDFAARTRAVGDGASGAGVTST